MDTGKSARVWVVCKVLLWILCPLSRTAVRRTQNWVHCTLVSLFLNLLKPTGYAMHQQCTNSIIVCSARTVFMCSVFT
jgi:hypothetical protein